jgi:hypothetical protein
MWKSKKKVFSEKQSLQNFQSTNATISKHNLQKKIVSYSCFLFEFDSLSRAFGRNVHYVSRFYSIELHRTMYLSLVDIIHETKWRIFLHKYYLFYLPLALSTFPMVHRFFSTVRSLTLTGEPPAVLSAIRAHNEISMRLGKS